MVKQFKYPERHGGGGSVRIDPIFGKSRYGPMRTQSASFEIRTKVGGSGGVPCIYSFWTQMKPFRLNPRCRMKRMRGESKWWTKIRDQMLDYLFTLCTDLTLNIQKVTNLYKWQRIFCMWIDTVMEGAWKRWETYTKFLSGNLKGNVHSEDLDVDGKVISEKILGK